MKKKFWKEKFRSEILNFLWKSKVEEFAISLECEVISLTPCLYLTRKPFKEFFPKFFFGKFFFPKISFWVKINTEEPKNSFVLKHRRIQNSLKFFVSCQKIEKNSHEVILNFIKIRFKKNFYFTNTCTKTFGTEWTMTWQWNFLLDSRKVH